MKRTYVLLGLSLIPVSGLTSCELGETPSRSIKAGPAADAPLLSPAKSPDRLEHDEGGEHSQQRHWSHQLMAAHTSGRVDRPKDPIRDLT